MIWEKEIHNPKSFFISRLPYLDSIGNRLQEIRN